MISKATDQEQTVGDLFRITREKRKKAITDVARELCIQQSYLIALEENDTANLPEEVFVLGYVRSYAKYLKLDEEEILSRFKVEKKDKLSHKELIFPEPYEGRKLPPKKLALIFSMIAIVLIAGFGFFSYWEEMQKTNIEIEAFLESNIETSQKNLPTTAEPVEEKQEEHEKDETEKDESKSMHTSDSPSESEPKNTTENITLSEPEKKNDSSIPSPVPSDGIIIRANQDSWVQVETQEGSIIISKILRQGEIYEVPEILEVYMDTGNAGGLEVIIDGKNLGPIGSAGQIKRKLALNKKSLRNLVRQFKADQNFDS